MRRWRARRGRSNVEREVEDLAARDPDWHRKAVGGLWDEVGRLQFRFLVEEGLRPDHDLVDIGCGSLRGGVHFVEYLERGRYAGVDVDERLLVAGREELRRRGLEGKEPLLVPTGDFDLPSLGRRFDFALAQSLFTHLPINDIIRCLVRVDDVLEPGGRFYATFFENPDGKRNVDPISHPTVDLPELLSYFDRDPFHYDVDTFRWMCESTRLEVAYLGEWGHPRDQRMLVFTKRADA
ncbi:MAG TPA: class I SAM-dependent methyltransferase [Actinomycetota bacterium]|nr:class I SAM-dependent methyltransferase [Actinomycetota bacterium]